MYIAHYRAAVLTFIICNVYIYLNFRLPDLTGPRFPFVPLVKEFSEQS